MISEKLLFNSLGILGHTIQFPSTCIINQAEEKNLINASVDTTTVNNNYSYLPFLHFILMTVRVILLNMLYH